MKGKLVILLVLSLVVLSSSFVFAEDDVADNSINETDDVVLEDQMEETNGSKFEFNREEFDAQVKWYNNWYAHNFKFGGNLEANKDMNIMAYNHLQDTLVKYLQEHPYWDPANEDIPDTEKIEPYPYAESPSRQIIFMSNKYNNYFTNQVASDICFESLNLYEDTKYNTLWGTYNYSGPYGEFYPGFKGTRSLIPAGGSSYQNAAGAEDLSQNNTSDNFEDILSNDTSDSSLANNSSMDKPKIAAKMEATGYPIFALLIASLFSIVAIRRR